MHKPENKMEREVTIVCIKPTSKPSPQKPVLGINWGNIIKLLCAYR
jgi:hypothetical protein